MIDLLIVLATALAPPLLLSNRFTFVENLGIGVTIALGVVLLFQLPIRRRPTWFPLAVIAFLSALVMEVAYFMFHVGR
jgi:hypothetical protein